MSRSLVPSTVVLAIGAAVTFSGCQLISSLTQVSSTFSEISRSGARGDPFIVKGFEIPPPHERPRFSAGAAIEDLTPPPGFPTGGHGPAGDVARGYWLRLCARAFFFEDRSGRALALVSADLFAIPAGLQGKVVQLISAELRKKGLDVSLPPESLVLAATHTHHGPGNFLTARVYNQFGSSYSGFSLELFNFLAERISSAVVKAIEEARAHAEPVELSVHVRRLSYDLVRNRSPWVFALNRDRDELLDSLNRADEPAECTPQIGEPTDFWDLPNCPRLRAADRTLTALDVNRVSGSSRRRIASLVFFAVHPTVLEAPTSFYSSDFIGYAMRTLEENLTSSPVTPVVIGFFNGAMGDITARRTRRDLLDVVDLGQRFGKSVLATLQQLPDRILHEPGIIVRASISRPLRGGGVCHSGAEKAELGVAPQFGAAALGGAEGDRTVLYDLGWRDGVRDKSFDRQGVKLPALNSRIVRALRFSDSFGPPDAFPDSLPVSLVTIGDLSLAAVPVEMTTAQGQAIRKRLGLPHGQLEIVGPANEYVSYCSSRDEYWAQDYMGASTLWGPAEGQFLACRLEELSRVGAIAPSERAPDRVYLTGVSPKDRFGREFSGEVERADDGLEHSLRDRGGLPERRLPWFVWYERSPGLEFQQAQGRRVTIWQREADGWHPWRSSAFGTEDDRGIGFLTVYLGNARWGAIWLRPLFETSLTGTFAFAVRHGSSVACSQAFDLAPDRTGPDQVETLDPCPPPLATLDSVP